MLPLAFPLHIWREPHIFYFFKRKRIYFQVYFRCMSILPTVYVFAPRLCCMRRGQKRVSDPLKLELQMNVSHCVSARNQLGSPGRQPMLLTYSWLSCPERAISWTTTKSVTIYIYFRLNCFILSLWKADLMLVCSFLCIVNNLTQQSWNTFS